VTQVYKKEQMDILLILLGLLCMLIGILGSFMPILPGAPISWVGLLLLHFTEVIPMDLTYLGVTLFIAILVFVLDYIIPAIATKKFGGSKYGVLGTTLGLIFGLFIPPFGIIIGPFLGAYIGEMLYQNNSKIATKAAFGSLVGFLTSSFLKFLVCVIFLGMFFAKVWDFREGLF